jgi:hypothetical protein
MYPNITHLHAHTCMHMQANYFDHADQLGTSISIYRINLNEFEQRIKKLVLHVFMCKNSNAHARACMHFQKKWLSFETSTNARLSSWKVSCWFPWVVSENITGQKSTGEEELDTYCHGNKKRSSVYQNSKKINETVIWNEYETIHSTIMQI